MELMEDIILKTLINKGSKLSSHDILGNYSKYVIIHSCDMHVYTKLHDTHQIFFYLTYTLWLMYHINWNVSDNVICETADERELNTLQLSKACVYCCSSLSGPNAWQGLHVLCTYVWNICKVDFSLLIWDSMIRTIKNLKKPIINIWINSCGL